MAEIRTLVPQEFPPLLTEIPDTPKKLHLLGTLPPNTHKLLAVVGSRRMTRYGREACEHLINGLRGYPVSIVSGLALGIDGTAHNAALTAGLHTVAIPGSGLNDSVLYPASHRTLAKRILESGGALVSEEEPNTRAAPYLFPKRNRIMAGMSHATLVIEAGLKSGTLITSRLATDYNRDVLTVPGSIFSESTEGSHLLLKLGATPIRTASDILEALNISEHTTDSSEVIVTENEQTILNALHEPLSRDELIRTLSMPTQEVNTLLLSMELKGLTKEALGKIQKC